MLVANAHLASGTRWWTGFACRALYVPLNKPRADLGSGNRAVGLTFFGVVIFSSHHTVGIQPS